jgi:hypothetical protein
MKEAFYNDYGEEITGTDTFQWANVALQSRTLSQFKKNMADIDIAEDDPDVINELYKTAKRILKVLRKIFTDQEITDIGTAVS